MLMDLMLEFRGYDELRLQLYSKITSIEGFFEVFGILYLIIVLRYFLAVSPFYLYTWIFRKNNLDKYLHSGVFGKKQISNEILYSMISSFIFAFSGVAVIFLWGSGKTQLYSEPAKYGYTYLIFSSVLLSLIHEVYFYFTHRWMHLKPVFKYVHQIHHLSKNTSPWASFSFHPWEAVILAVFLPLSVMIVPLHPLVFLAYTLFMTLTAISNHLGVELIKSPRVLKYFISGTHHSAHHKFYNKNFGLYYRFMDRLFCTDHKEREV